MRRCFARCAADAAAAAASHAPAAASPVSVVAPLRPHQFRVIVREMRADELPPEFGRAAATPATPTRSASAKASQAAESRQAQVKAIDATKDHAPAATTARTAGKTKDAAADAQIAPEVAAALTSATPAVRHSVDRFRSFQSLLHQQEQRPPVSLPIVPVAASTAPAEPSLRDALRSSVSRLLGVDVTTAAVRVVWRLQMHCDRPVFRTRLGFTSHPLSVIELRALHLWMMHVRLRDEPEPAPTAGSPTPANASVIPSSFVDSLFQVFWERQTQLVPDAPASRMRDMQEYAYGAFHALDHSLLALLRAQAEAEQQQSGGAVAPGGGSKLKSGEFQPGLSIQDLEQGADVLLLSSLWKNTLLGDRTLHPLVVASLLRYVSATLAKLYATPVDIVWKGNFEWIQPETSAADTPVDDAQKQAYFEMLDRQVNPVAAASNQAAEAAKAAADTSP